ncbi:MAG TPA: copper resistance system multicopper oxidase [Steroidobacteraceae bacterium]|nr:copper resistance system multicopper oxidase [Steroidobacteraceae bacterium]
MYRSRFESRRRFVQGLAGGALVLVGGRQLGWGAAAGRSAAASSAGGASWGIGTGGARGGGIDGSRSANGVGDGSGSSNGASDGVLSGTDFRLEVGASQVNFTGVSRHATVVNGQLPAPLLRWRQGDTVTIRVTNRLPAPTSIHWHGMILPANMDGVPGISFPGIGPGQTFEYRFPVTQAGTYWYHSHSRFQEQVGLYGPIVIEPRAGERQRSDRDHVVLLSDWTDTDPEHIYRLLKVQSDYFNYNRRTAADFFADVRKQGLSATVADRRMWGQMRMNASDLLDVSGHTYTYLMNGVTPAANWTGLFRRGERVRLRIINGSSMSFFDIRIPGLAMTVVAADGQDVEPVTVDEFRIGAAEVYDVIVEPKDDRAYTIFAQSMDRTGYARGTLAPAAGMEAEIPPLDPPSVLSMADMGMSMASMDHMDMPGMDMSGTPTASPPPKFGPNVDMVAQQPKTSLSDPGVGLRNNGRRVLTYADLHTIGGPIDTREPSRDIRLHLTGHMQRYVWSFDGQKFSESQPLRFNYGERLRIVLINDSMMNHPIHLHGMWSEVESPAGEFVVRKHTIIVQPGQQLSYGVSASALGRWAFHCHLLYHMEAGMFREVAVEQGAHP